MGVHTHTLINNGDLYIKKETKIVFTIVIEQAPDDKNWVTIKEYKKIMNNLEYIPLRYVRFDTFANDFESLEVWTSRRLLEQESGNGEKQIRVLVLVLVLD